ncbi:MAG: hypothetical protein IJV31_10225 [Clostridia bacterium]|nr:hypothetical protein [Clostridia bacterium]
MYDFEIFDNAAALNGRVSSHLLEKEFSEDRGSEQFKRKKEELLKRN